MPMKPRMTGQSEEKIRSLAWIMDAKKRGEAIERESERRSRQLDHMKQAGLSGSQSGRLPY